MEPSRTRNTDNAATRVVGQATSKGRVVDRRRENGGDNGDIMNTAKKFQLLEFITILLWLVLMQDFLEQMQYT